LEDARGRMNEHTLAAERHQGRSTYARDQITQAEARAEEADSEASTLQERLGPLTAHLDEVRTGGARLLGERGAAEGEQKAAEGALRESSERQAAAVGEQEAARQTQVAVLERLATLQNQREATTANAERAAAELGKLAAEQTELEGERARAAETL